MNRAVYRQVTMLLLFLAADPCIATPADDFVTTWKTDNPGVSSSTSITIPMQGGPYDVDWDNDGVFDQFGPNGPVTHDFGVAGTYTVRLNGSFDAIQFNFSGDVEKILDIAQWGSNPWSSMSLAFSGAVNMQVSATDTPDFSGVTDMAGMFWACPLADPDTSGWDTASVTSMAFMFDNAILANPDTSGWDTSLVTSMINMFTNVVSANPDVEDWDTGSVTNMSGMFYGALAFDRDLSGWDMAAVTNAQNMLVHLSEQNYDALLVAWSSQDLQPGVLFGGGNSNYCSEAAANARAAMEANSGWQISDGGRCIVPFDRAYVPNLGDNSVSVIDTFEKTVVDTITVGELPVALAVNPTGTRAYVANELDATVSVIDTQTLSVVSTVDVGPNPNGIAVSPDGRYVYVSIVAGAGGVDVIDAVSNTVVDHIMVGVGATGLDVTPDNSALVVVNQFDETVSIVDLESSMMTVDVPVGGVPLGVTISPDSSHAYVTNFGSDTVSVINLETQVVVETIATPGNPFSIVASPIGEFVYVANSTGSVSVIDVASNTLADMIALGGEPFGIAVNDFGTRIFVSNLGSANVAVINADTRSVMATIDVGGSPTGFGDFTGPTLDLLFIGNFDPQ